jgi:hypothetical protein
VDPDPLAVNADRRQLTPACFISVIAVAALWKQFQLVADLPGVTARSRPKVSHEVRRDKSGTLFENNVADQGKIACCGRNSAGRPRRGSAM